MSSDQLSDAALRQAQRGETKAGFFASHLFLCARTTSLFVSRAFPNFAARNCIPRRADALVFVAAPALADTLTLALAAPFTAWGRESLPKDFRIDEVQLVFS
eukprot:6200442-Pleurochrysis_carterae.AAC.1